MSLNILDPYLPPELHISTLRQSLAYVCGSKL